VKLIGYTRVSTTEQANSGLGIEAQNRDIRAEVDRRGWLLAGVESDTASGRSTRLRPGLASALAAVDAREADGLIVAKLDRLSRSVLDFAQLVCRAQADGWNLIVLDLGLDLSSPQGRFTAHVLCACAELERELISRRTKDALAAARARGIHTGMTSKVSSETVSVIRAERANGATLTAIADQLNTTGTATPTGSGKWHPSSVRAVLNRPPSPSLREPGVPVG
jgi:DNA invertase Pin-like site-specific DNA recombinase